MFINGQPAGSRYFDAECDKHFNEYVKRTRTVDFEYSPMNGGVTTHGDLWKGRRLRIKMHPSSDVGWREAKIVEWDEYLMGPFAPVAKWSVTIEFTDIVEGDEDDDGGAGGARFDLGDVVEIIGLENATEHNGKEGLIRKRVDQRYVVQYEDKHVGVKPGNLRRLKQLELNVHRCNVEGGGVLEGFPERLSFEWIDEASPKIILSEEPWTVTCPSCRKVTKSSDLLGVETTAPTTSECPICLEIKECTRLPSCTHNMCTSCLVKCQKKLDGSSFFRVEDVTVDLSDEDIASQLEKNSREVPANRSTPEHVNQICKAFQELGALTEDGEIDGLKQFKQWLLTHPIEFWCPSAFLNYLSKCIGVEAAEILFFYMEGIRETEKYKRFVEDVMRETKKHDGEQSFRLCGFFAGGDDLMVDPRFHFSIQMLHLTEQIGLKYEERGDYYAAIRWYKKNIEFATSAFDKLDGDNGGLSNSISNLGLAQKRAGLYQTALETYNRALELNAGGEDNLAHNKRMLEEEMDEWKGSSGYTTPRLDE